MTYRGTVKNGVVVFDGDIKPPEGITVDVNQVGEPSEVGKGLERLAGKAVGLPPDLAEKHDQHRRERLGL